MNRRLINYVMDSILCKDDVNWNEIDVLNDLLKYHTQGFEQWLIYENQGSALISHLEGFGAYLGRAKRVDHIHLASVNRLIYQLKGVLGF